GPWRRSPRSVTLPMPSDLPTGWDGRAVPAPRRRRGLGPDQIGGSTVASCAGPAAGDSRSPDDDLLDQAVASAVATRSWGRRRAGCRAASTTTCHGIWPTDRPGPAHRV